MNELWELIGRVSNEILSPWQRKQDAFLKAQEWPLCYIYDRFVGLR